MLLPIFAAMSCEMLEEMFQTEPTVFEASLTEQQLNASQTEVTARITCDVKWTAKLADSSWGSISQTVMSDNNIGHVVLNLGFNEGKKRSNTLLVTAGTVTKSLSFDQGGLEELIQPANIQLRGTQPATVSFKPGVDWKLTSDSPWLALPERTSGLAGVDASLSISAKEEFVDVGTRQGSVTFTFAGKYPVTVPVTQYQTDAIILEKDKVEIDYKANTLTLRVDSNLDYTVTSTANWVVHQAATKALNVSQESFVIEANPTSTPRTGLVFFTGTGGKTSAQLTVVQEGYDPILDNTTCGLYGIAGMNYTLQPNTMQVSRVLSGNTYTYRIIEFSDLYICQVTGLPVVQEDESKCTLNLTVTRAGATLLNTSAECLLVGQSDELRWYRVVGDSAYFIIGNTIK